MQMTMIWSQQSSVILGEKSLSFIFQFSEHLKGAVMEHNFRL